MSNRRFTPKQLRFLELFFSGFMMKDAARGAGYQGRSDQSLCNLGLRILRKFVGDPKTVFRRRPGAIRGKNISQMLEGSPKEQLAALKIISTFVDRR
jgi:hypothetical protein